jgi:general secretion pathway protein G
MSHQRPNRKHSKGFTLIELMLVIIIIGVLVAVTAPILSGRSEQARVAAARADVEGSIGVALDLYELDMGRYPTSDEGLPALSSEPASAAGSDGWNGPYVKTRVGDDPWGHPYEYRFPSERNPRMYDLFSRGPDGLEGTDDDITSWGDDQ